MKLSKGISSAAAIGILASAAIVAPAFAQTSPAPGGGAWAGRGGVRTGTPPGIFGTVSAVSVNGNTDIFDVTAYARPMRPMPEQASSGPAIAPVIQASTTYTVDATNATIYKGSATTTVSVLDIATGDTVMVQGTVSGTSVTATVVRDGVDPMMGGRPGMPGRGFGGHGASSTPLGTPAIQGNGEPVIGGSVTNVSGTTITVTNASNVTYTIDAASTTIVKNGTSTTIGNIAVGDSIIVQGTVNGNSVTASSIIDQGVKGTNGSSTNGSSTKPKGGGEFGFGGIFSAIGGFFQHLFGF